MDVRQELLKMKEHLERRAGLTFRVLQKKKPEKKRKRKRVICQRALQIKKRGPKSTDKGKRMLEKKNDNHAPD